SPSAAGHLVSPEFIQFLIDNPETVMIIEDAENIIMDRKLGSSSAVSNLLNLSDGLLADCLNIQLICTFNSPLTVVDSALMRMGRLIAHYEFGKLGVAKSQQLSNHFGFDTEITTPMTIAELANQHEQDGSDEKTEVIGFRIGETMMN
ncbi:MAG TPA: AAA family ATPase, partial [Chitinophagaceae bacterium]